MPRPAPPTHGRTLPSRWPCAKPPFSYHIALEGEHESFRVYRLTYPSPLPGPVVQNNTIPAELYVPKGIKPDAKPRPAVICLHILGGGFELTRLQCTAFAARGIPAIWLTLPYYAERSIPGGTRALAADPGFSPGPWPKASRTSAVRFDVLASRPEVDPRQIGVMGVSMGGILAATAAGQEPRIARAVLLLAGGDLLPIVHHARETRTLSETLQPAARPAGRGRTGPPAGRPPLPRRRTPPTGPAGPRAHDQRGRR